MPAAAMLLGAPIKWVEDRRESFTATNHEREQDWDLEAAVDADGRLLAVRGQRLPRPRLGDAVRRCRRLQNSGTNLLGPYVLRPVHIDFCALPDQFRAGHVVARRRPAAGHLRDGAAARPHRGSLDIPRDEVRRRNLIRPRADALRHAGGTRDGLPMTYDSGDYPECQRRALAAAGWSDFPARQEAARQQGRYIGLGLCNYVEGTGRGPFESVSVRIGPSGKIVVATGATDQGQGTHTMLAQLAAEAFGVRPSACR